RRFMGSKAALSDGELNALTTPDGVDHFALGAMRRNPDTGEPEGLGVARFARVEDDAELAEAAVTVVDAAQRLGLGSLLLRRLAAAARERGVRRFRGDVLACNEPMRRLLADHAGASVVEVDDGVLRVEVELPSFSRLMDASRTGRDVLGQVLAQVASAGATLRLSDVLLKRR
ncbi:MAG: GNAT family N-acetyltransferase, partial [Gemmatimonadota bacterium]